MRNIRVTTVKAPALVNALVDAGFTATVTGPAKTSWNGGCGDHTHCPQHPGATAEPLAWRNIQTNASGKTAHRIWATAGLV